MGGPRDDADFDCGSAHLLDALTAGALRAFRKKCEVVVTTVGHELRRRLLTEITGRSPSLPLYYSAVRSLRYNMNEPTVLGSLVTDRALFKTFSVPPGTNVGVE